MKRYNRTGGSAIKQTAVLAFLCGTMLSICQAAQKPRIVVMTDIGGDPDDRQSMVRFLLYTCDFEVEGLCTGFGHGHYQKTRPDLIHEAVDAYGKGLPSLRKHRKDYPSYERLKSLIKDGHNGDPHKAGPGMNSEASDWIVKVLERDDPRPVWFSIWGGPRELAQALWKLEQTRSPEQCKRLRQKVFVHSINDQDRTAGWIKERYPDVFWIFSSHIFRGMWAIGDQELVDQDWLKEHVLAGHGPLGPIYPPKAAGKNAVKEGDTPSFFYVLPNGLSDPMHPEWGNWGGRFRQSGRGNEYIDAVDLWQGQRDSRLTVARWRQAYQNEFEARMDWCIKPHRQANHTPTAVCNGDKSIDILHRDAKPGGRVELTAAGSSDPDGDGLSYKWWVYPEAGSYWAEADIDSPKAVRTTVQVPEKAAGRTIHVILEVTDTGAPPLTAYRRAILQVSGEPVEAPPGAEQFGRAVKPVTRLDGPPERLGKWRFYRAINLNGTALEIDGRKWEGDDAKGFVCKDRALNSPQIQLWPPTDENRARMIHAFRWSRQADLKVTNVPDGKYAVYAYVWEETNPERFSISLNGKQVERQHNSGHQGQWQRLGPWIASVRQGSIRITTKGGAANFSGIEIWRTQQ